METRTTAQFKEADVKSALGITVVGLIFLGFGAYMLVKAFPALI